MYGILAYIARVNNLMHIHITSENLLSGRTVTCGLAYDNKIS